MADPVDAPSEPLRRAFDVVASGAALFLGAPVFLLIAIAIRIESPGSIFFAQKRVGRNRELFYMLKFRSMVQDAAALGPAISGKRDPRITRVGDFLRRTKLDEIPQFWNVLRGDMTMVGPRAEVPDMIRHYTAEELEILTVKPGLTGPGQIYFTTDQAGELDEVEDAETHYIEHQLHPKLAIDLDYVRTRTWKKDLGVLWQTVRLILFQRGSSIVAGTGPRPR